MSTIKDIYIIGSSGHASVVTELIEQLCNYKIVGFIDDYKSPGEKFLNYEVLGNIEYLITIAKTKKIYVAIAIGDSNNRELITNKLKDLSVIYPVLIHPSAQISKRSKIAEGTIIFANSIVACNSIIGKHCLINHGCCIDHDSKIKDYVTLCPNVFIAGNVIIGYNTIIGLGTNIIEKIKIGKNVYIGAGSTVISNQRDNSVIFGCPAKYIRDNNDNEIFFK
ncbi:acetyltransferase [Providencia stuartii]|nr:acetyltransferase [Providencia stuartii]